jgi:hypothetical protein
MNKIKWYPLIFIGLVLLLAGSTSGCVSVTIPETAQDSTISSDFTTYTNEGLFSISYPSDWVPVQSANEELFENVMTEMISEDPNAPVEDITILFFAGKETGEGWYPSVNIMTDRRSSGYWTLDEVDEANRRYQQQYTTGFKELSIQKTTIDGMEAIITISEDNEAGYGRWQYVQMTAVYGDYVWMVTCSCTAQDFGSNENKFMRIVKSFRILQ